MIEVKRDWRVTFADMLTLLLTFFVFVLAVARFRSDDFRRFWRQPDGFRTEEQPGGSLTRFPLIPGIAPPFLPVAAEELLRDLVEELEQGSGRGVRFYYDESKLALWIPEETGFALNEIKPSGQLLDFLLNLAPRLAGENYPLRIEGHTDSLPSRGLDNYEISLLRALAVAEVLLNQGIPAERLAVSAYGPHRPAADNASEAGRMINRRVEIHVMLNY